MSRIKKQLWRRWRRWKKALWVGAACIALTALAWRSMRLPEEISGLLSNSAYNDEGELAQAVFKMNGDSSEGKEKDVLSNEQLLEFIARSGLSRTVHLKISYVSGEEIQTLPGVKSPLQLKEIINAHPAWNGWISSEGDLWLEQNVNDLSELTKKEAYIGVDAFGNLTLFQGPPAQEKVMKTFFQLDMGSLKSALPKQMWKELHDGIRIQDIEEYNSVLSTFSDYAREAAEHVIQNKH